MPADINQLFHSDMKTQFLKKYNLLIDFREFNKKLLLRKCFLCEMIFRATKIGINFTTTSRKTVKCKSFFLLLLFQSHNRMLGIRK